MNKSYLILGICLLFLLKSPVAMSISCKQVSSINYDLCKEILNSKITNEEKQILISNLDYESSFIPDHKYIFNKNLKLEINGPPNGVKQKNKTYIKNAWVKIFALMPSVLYNKSLYSPEKTSLLSRFNYDLKIPENYYSHKYPQKSHGDCKRKYYILENKAKNKVYSNDVYSGEGELVNVLLNKDSKIKTIYEIYVRIKIKHYEWNRYCKFKNFDGRCIKYSKKCKYRNSEYKNENLLLVDSINVKLYKNNLFAYIFPINIYNGVTNLKSNYSDSIEVKFKNSEYNFNKYIYSINYSLAPYYISTLIAEEYNQEKILNLFSGKNIIAVRNPTNCKIKAYDFFNIIEKNCNNKYQNINFFIKTNKLKYAPNEKIIISIFPNNISVNLNYGNTSKIIKNKGIIIAKINENRIIAKYNGLISEKVIYITNTKRLLVIWNLIIFTLLNYFLYILLKKYYNKIK